MKYSCSNYVCPPPKYEDKYDIVITKEGYKLLVPKSTNKVASDDDELTLTRSRRYQKSLKGYPYINDEIPSSKELDNSIYGEDNNDIDGTENDFEERANNHIDKRPYRNRFEKKKYTDKIYDSDDENSDLTFEESDANEDAERLSEEDDSDEYNGKK
ncbi:uncharacterized protein [Leptinotarsa decemlineata]|uniref:uncharacterized protein n=1 Tax=Leptinotarsa decemlineata TaxID=7539 RepID=UPI003D305AC9